MSYDEWLLDIKTLENSNNQEIKEKMCNAEVNNNIRDMLSPKLVELIKKKFNNITKSILYEISNIFENEYSLDFYLVKMKKDLEFIHDMINIPQIFDESRNELKSTIETETEHVYQILIDEARVIDPIGQFELIIKKNKYKGSDL